jgi:hypothetical protein
VSAPTASRRALPAAPRLEGLRKKVWQRLATIDIGTAEAALVAVGLALAVFLRLWQLNKLGFNSDEAVYSGRQSRMIRC